MNSKGLQYLTRDRRDWSFHKNFGAAPLSGLPDEYLLGTAILDQNGYNECTGYMKAAIDELNLRWSRPVPVEISLARGEMVSGRFIGLDPRGNLRLLDNHTDSEFLVGHQGIEKLAELY